MSGLICTSYFFHMARVVEHPDVAFTVSGVTAAIAGVVGGYIVDHAPLKAVLVAAAVSYVICSAALLVPLPGFASFVFPLFMGAGLGLTQNASAVGYAKAFGRRHLGAIQGMSTSLAIISTAAGPLPLSLAIEHDMVPLCIGVFAAWPALQCVLILVTPMSTVGEAAGTAGPAKKFVLLDDMGNSESDEEALGETDIALDELVLDGPSDEE